MSSVADLGWVRSPWGADEARGAPLSGSPHVYDVSPFPWGSPGDCSFLRGCSCAASAGQKVIKKCKEPRSGR